MSVISISHSSESRNPFKHNRRIGAVIWVHVYRGKDYAWASQCPLRPSVLTAQDQ